MGPDPPFQQRCYLCECVARRFRQIIAVDESQECDRLAAFREQKVQQGILIVIDHAVALCRGDFNCPLATFLQHIGISRQLGIVGVTAGERATLVTDVLVENGGGESIGASVDRFADECRNPGGFLGRGRTLHGLLAHDVVPEGGQRGKKRQVDRRLTGLGRVEELGESLPIPRDSLIENVEGDAFDIDKIPHGDLAGLGQTWRDPDTTIAHDDAGDTVPRGRRYRPVPADLCVIVRVGIDEARRHHAITRIDDFMSTAIDLSDLYDLAARDRHVGTHSWRSGSIDNGSVLDHEIVGHRAYSLGFPSNSLHMTAKSLPIPIHRTHLRVIRGTCDGRARTCAKTMVRLR